MQQSDEIKTSIDKISLEDKLEAIKMIERGKRVQDVAVQFDTFESTIHYWIRRKEILLKEYQESQLKKIAETNGDYKSFDFPSNKSVENKMRKTTVKISANEKLEAIERHKSGETLISIAERYGTTASTVYYWIKSEKQIEKRCNKENNKEKIKSSSDLLKPEKRKCKEKIDLPNTKRMKKDENVRISTKQQNDSKCKILDNKSDENKDKFYIEEYKSIKLIYENYMKMSIQLIQSKTDTNESENYFTEFSNSLNSEYYKEISDRYNYLHNKYYKLIK